MGSRTKIEQFGRTVGERSVKSNDVNPPPPPRPQSPPAHFVLVHGIGGGAWCWYKMRCLMENSGFKVSCLDLKGAGMDPTDPNTILSFQDYNKPLLDFLSSLPHNEQVILVGHSTGGLSLSDAIIKFGKEKIKLAVFVAATMLKSGFMTDQDLKDDSTLAAMLVRPGPIQAILTAKFGGGGGEKLDPPPVPRIYIKTREDNVMKSEQQAAMIEKWPPSDVYDLESDHSPFFSAPFLLFGFLVKAAALSFES